MGVMTGTAVGADKEHGAQLINSELQDKGFLVTSTADIVKVKDRVESEDGGGEEQQELQEWHQVPKGAARLQAVARRRRRELLASSSDRKAHLPNDSV